MVVDVGKQVAYSLTGTKLLVPPHRMNSLLLRHLNSPLRLPLHLPLQEEVTTQCSASNYRALSILT